MGTAYGFDTTNYIYNVAAAAKSYVGTGSFYVRYLASAVISSSMTSSTAVKECQYGYDNGMRYLAFIQAPGAARISGTAAAGTADATAFINAVVSVFDTVGPLALPSSGVIYLYLDVENSSTISSAYWGAWATYLDDYQFAGSAPFYPAMYCNPKSSKNPCSVSSTSYIWNLWANEPEPCAACGHFGSVSYQAYTCSGLNSYMWQMAEQGGCQQTCGKSGYPNVDANMTSPSVTLVADMFSLPSRP